MTDDGAPVEHRPLLLVSLYAPGDVSLHEQLEKHLTSLKRKKLISLWSVDKTLAGANQEAETSGNLHAAHIILLLLSVEFVASDYHYDLMQRALQLKNEKNISVVAIILRPVEWEDASIHVLHVLPTSGKPVTMWDNPDEVFLHITREIRKIVEAQLNPAVNTWTLTETQRRYLHWLIKRTALLDTRGISSAQRLPPIKLEDVYISRYASREEPFQDAQPVYAQEASATKTSRQAPQSLSSVADHNSHLIILGEPGSGKTTFLRSLALKHAQALHNQEEESSVEDVRFPILLRIADYVEYGMHQGQSLSDFLADDCKRYECPSSALADTLSTELQAGRCLVLLDGLDEVVHADDRRMVVQKLEAFVGRYDDVPNRFILTCRSAGYDEAPLSNTFAHYHLQGLEESDIQRFLVSWCPALEMALSPDATKTREMRIADEINTLMNSIQTISGVGQLATNPLLLRILAQLHMTGVSLPKRRVALYTQVMETLIQTWRPSQGVSASALSDISPLLVQPHITSLLSWLAYWFHCNKSNGRASEDEICRELGKEWACLIGTAWREEDPEIEKTMRQFLHAVEEQTGILVEETPHRYGFAHLTFEEYFVACYLIANRQERVRRLRTHLHNPRWQEPILLALGLLEEKEALEETHVLVETAILASGERAQREGLESSPYEALLSRDYLFALRCLGENIFVHPSLAAQLIERLLREMTQQEGPGQFQKYQEALAEGLRAVETSHNYAFLLLPDLTKNLEYPDSHLCFWSLYSLGRIGRTFAPDAVRKPLLRMLREDDTRLRSAALWSLSQIPGPEITVTLLEVLRNDIDTSVRQNAIQYLGQRRDTSPQVMLALLDALHEALETDRFLLSWTIVESLGQLGDASPDVISSLIVCLRRALLISTSGDTVILLNDSALKSLRQLSHLSPDVALMMADAFHDAAPCVRVFVANALETFDAASPEVIAALSNVPPKHSPHRVVQAPMVCAKQWSWLPDQIEALLLLRLRDSRAWVRWEAVKAVGQWPELSDRMENALLSMLQDEDNSIRTRVIKTLNAFEMTSQVFSAFKITLFNDPDASVRACVAECLGDGDWPSREIVPALLHALHDTEDHVRYCVIQSLGRITPISPAIMETFILSLLHDTSFGVRWEVVKNLQRLETLSETALCAVLQGLTDPHEAVRWDCALLLGQHGSCDERTRQSLLHGLSDTDLNVRKACSQAFIQLGQRYPEDRGKITEGLMQIIQTSNKAVSYLATYGSPREVAYNAVWSLNSENALEASG